jgi:arginine exporter protein ArgO
VAQSTLERQPAAEPAAAQAAQPLGFAELLRRWPAVTVGVALVVVSVALVLWAGTRPSFDAYGWLVWGHQTVAGSLDTNAAPSWKPLPYVFTVPYAVFGHYELWLWMITAVAISLAGAIFAGRIAYRLTLAGTERRYAAIAAAVFAGLALLGLRDYWHYILSYQSDPLIVALCLGAIDCHLSGRPRWAFLLGALAALGRPEVWLFVGLYCIWAWRAVPSMRWLIGAGVLAVVALWFGIPALTSRSAFVAGSNAIGSGRALHSNKLFGTIDRFLDMHETPLEVVALLSVAFAVWRRDRTTLVLAGGAAVWVIVEIAFSLHGWPGLPRYMFAAGAVMVVLAALGVGRLLSEPPRLSSGAAWAGAIVAVVIVASLVPAAVSRGRTEHKDLRVQRHRTHEINRLAGTVTRLGGAARLRPCGEPLTRLEYQTILAWTLRTNVSSVGFKYGPAIRSGRPLVLFTPRRHGGWKVQAVHQRVRSCRRLPR